MIENFFLQLVIILFSARFLGELVSHFDIPSVIGELLAGIIIGPSLFGWIESTETIRLLAEIGIIFLLFEVGLESDLTRLAKTGLKACLVAGGGVIFPFVFGFVVSHYIFHLNLLISLFIASTLTATSIGITIRVLTDLKRQTEDESQIVLGAAVIDDIIGIILLSVVSQMAKGNSIDYISLGKIGMFIFLFLLLAPIGAKFISMLLKYYEEKHSEIPGLIPSAIVALILFFAWLAHEVGAPELLGGFAAGLALSSRFLLPGGLLPDVNVEFSHKVETQMKPIVHLFTPIFFVAVGLSLNLREIDWGSSFIWTLSISLLVMAILGKLASGFLLYSESRWIKWAVGLAMIPRGEVGLIFAEVGRVHKLFNNEVYAALIIVIAVTTILTPFAMRYFYTHYKEPVHD